MIFKIPRRRLSILIPAIFLLFFSFSSFSFGESVFLKDGIILEGKIIKENDKKITITISTDEMREIDRKDIIRTLYHDAYKDKRYLTKMDGTVIEVYIVDEDKNGYTYRLKLDSPDEVRIPKDEVDGISKRKVMAPGLKEETREEKLITRAPIIRLGFGFADLGGGYFSGDVFLYRHRNSNGNGFDLLLRGIYGKISVDNESELADLGYIITSGYELKDATITQTGLGGGLRYIHGWYAGGLLWQGYALAYYEYISVDMEMYTYQGTTENGSESNEKYKSNGMACGIGIEVALFQNFGIFGEYTYGYNPALPEKKNIEGNVLRFGVTLRTSYL